VGARRTQTRSAQYDDPHKWEFVNSRSIANMRAVLWLFVSALAAPSDAMPAPAAVSTGHTAGRALAAAVAPMVEFVDPAETAGPRKRTLTDFELLTAYAGHRMSRALLSLPSSGPIESSSAVVADPEAARFAAYVGTLAPGLYATYLFIGIGYFFVMCCCVLGCCLCCSMALCPTELCVGLSCC